MPRGYVDQDGNLHRHGAMRLATAMDEIAPLRDPRVRSNQASQPETVRARVLASLRNWITPLAVAAISSLTP